MLDGDATAIPRPGGAGCRFGRFVITADLPAMTPSD